MKMKFTPYAKFVCDNNFKYRTETYLSLIDDKEEFILSLKGEKCIGAIIMINPGGSECKGKYNQIEEATKDKTMEKIEKSISMAYQNKEHLIPKNGYFEIFNLFNLCEKDLRKAIKLYKEYKQNGNTNSLMENPIINEIKSETHWIWLAWGCTSSSELGKRRKSLYDDLKEEFTEKIVGVCCKGKNGRFKHPNRKSEKYFEEVSKQIKELIN